MRSLAHESFDPELEAELRATLRRKADDLEPNLPTWEDLIRDSEAVVVSLRTGRPLLDGRIQGRRRAWIRPLLAAAVSLALAMAAGVVIGRAAGNDPAGQADGTTDAEEADEAGNDQALADSSTRPDLIAPGEEGFRSSEPAILFPFAADEERLRAEVDAASAAGERPQTIVELANPEAVASRYLHDVLSIVEVEDPYEEAGPYLVWTDPPEIEAYGHQPDLQGRTVETTSVWWTVRDSIRKDVDAQPVVVAQGRVFLRNLGNPSTVDDPDAWVVTGADTLGVGLMAVQRNGDEMVFSVNTDPVPRVDVTDSAGVRLEVLVNGIELSAYRTSATFLDYQAMVAATEPANIQLRYLDGDGIPLSVVAVAFAPDPERPAPAEAETSAVLTTPPTADPVPTTIP